MTQTGMIYRTEFAANVADRCDRNGKLIAQAKRFPTRAAGSMTTSANDLTKYAAAMLTGELLISSSRAEMLRPVLDIHSISSRPRSTSQMAPKLHKQASPMAQAGVCLRTPASVLPPSKRGTATARRTTLFVLSAASRA